MGQNAALDRLLSFIQLPCKYRDAGCQESFALPHKHDHESVCQFRPVQCQYQCHGCDVVTSAKDMFWHDEMCQYRHHPHQNVLPNMPNKVKTVRNISINCLINNIHPKISDLSSYQTLM